MLRLILLSVFLVTTISIQESRCDAGQQSWNQDQGNQNQGNQQQGNQANQQNNQNGDQNDKKNPKYDCDGFELTCPIKKIRYVLHKIRTAITPSNEFHFPEFKLHNPFGDNSGDNKNNNGNQDNNKDNNKQNGDSQNQGSSDFNPPAFNPPDFQLHNPLGNNQQNGNS